MKVIKRMIITQKKIDELLERSGKIEEKMG